MATFASLFETAPAASAAAPTTAGRASFRRLKQRELTYLLINLATLIDNGLPLAKALLTLERERSLRKHAPLLEHIRRQVETGASFSNALGQFPASFNNVLICQVRSGERSGTLAATLERVSEQLDKSDQIRAHVIRKLSYPLLLLLAGVAAVTFMMLFVIPVFQQTYAEAGVPLPLITRAMISISEFVLHYGWLIPLTGVATVIAVKRLRQLPAARLTLDRSLLQVPLLGDWWRNLIVLQFMEVLGNLLESGFKVVDALEVSAGTVNNQALLRSIEGLKSAVMRGERFSRELDSLGDLFPPVVGQLVVVGEKTGNLAKATAGIREHLRRQIERQTNLLVGTIEPLLTITLAILIGFVLLAIYLPMFDMIGVMDAH